MVSASASNPTERSRARSSLSGIPVGINDGMSSGQAHQSQDNHNLSAERSGRGGIGRGQGRLEDQDIPKSDWGRTLDTTISIPEGGAEERADQHEANASREHDLEREIIGDGRYINDGGSGISIRRAASKESQRSRPD